MGMRRSRYQIILRILEVCIDESNKTKIVSQAHLNFKTVNSYIDFLINKGLINVKQGPIANYETTEKGRNFLKHLIELNSEFKEL